MGLSDFVVFLRGNKGSEMRIAYEIIIIMIILVLSLITRMNKNVM